ncbi:hypothetical protein TRAPUB_9133 [Trametes pubescens]|uniref:CST complex subunit STN1 n=1 Tax=Trametes pubescens TaxID=154538 RepID=A0A1M2W399_TRAPU|nr:hypothetical protein TRAPUB_9133 [Trametes pubescens]
MEFFWIGRIPCRTVRLVGLVVGVQVWEKRTVYTIDDGTAVIDCAHAHAQIVPPSPVKPKSKDVAPSGHRSKVAGPSFADYLPPPRATTSTSAASTRRTVVEPPPPPKPVARIGQSVRVVGRVISRYDTRMLLVDDISRCASYNEEPAHWLAVSELHRTTYHPKETLPPFVPPPIPSASTYTSQFYAAKQPGSPSKHGNEHVTQEPGTPASVRSSIASTNTSPSTVASASSPVSGASDKPPANRGRSARTADATPRPSRLRPFNADKASSSSMASDADTDTEDESDDPGENDDQVYGYTLSHLRRVPELSLLARRVVHAEAHRRAKEERKKAKADTECSQSRSKPKSSSTHASTSTSASASTAPKGGSKETDLTDPKAAAAATKRLFRQAIRTLFQDGSIVLWDGPIRPLPAPALDPLIPSSFSSALWKANASTASSASASASASMSASTTASSSRTSRSFPAYDEWDEDAPLSDPEPSEEAYVPLTPVYFARVLERAIATLVAEASAAPAVSGDATPKPAQRKAPSLIERLRAQEAGTGADTRAGPTAAELLAWLRTSDERWARVGLWSVEEALEWGRREGRLWCVGKGRWEVCG